MFNFRIVGNGRESFCLLAHIGTPARDHNAGMVATLVASVLLLLGATSVFAELKGNLDEMWGIDKPCQPAFSVLLRTRLLSFGMVIVLALAFLLHVS